MDSDNCFRFEVVRTLTLSLQTISRNTAFSHASRLENVLNIYNLICDYFKRLVCNCSEYLYTRSYVCLFSELQQKNVHLFVHQFLAIIVISATDVFFFFCFQSLWLQFRSATAANAVDYSNFVLSFLANIVRSATVVFLFIVFKSLWLHFWSATAANVNAFLDYSKQWLKENRFH